MAKTPTKSKKNTSRTRAMTKAKTLSSSKSTKARLRKTKSIPRAMAGAQSKKEASKQALTRPPDLHFPIVAIGASAGGLEAFEDFFSHMDANTGMAFVVLTHQHPEHPSMLPELLGKCTGMEVAQVNTRLVIQKNHVYLSSPGKNMSIFNGVLIPSDFTEPRGLTLPIDFFFRSLAQDQKEKAIGIILSGTGTDGTLGLRAIKGESGMTMAQDEASAKFFGMPGSAISSGQVDYILPPNQMPDQLIKYVRSFSRSSASPALMSDPAASHVMQEIFLQLRSYTGHDFSMYKYNTTRRRIERRMNVHHIDNLKDYLKFLRDNQQEAKNLFKELLIGVTAFFRDPEAFDYMEKKLLPKLLSSIPKDSSIRIWVPACASGEEVYSLAILLTEHLRRNRMERNVQIFGTDLDPDVIEVARKGLYPAGIAADIPPRFLKSNFDRIDDNFRIKSPIRDMAVFAQHNVVKDPPFTKLDLISCRNLLIYLEPALQKKLFALFHYALKPDGRLFLGSSESVGAESRLFKPDSKKFKIYTRLPSQPQIITGFDDTFSHITYQKIAKESSMVGKFVEQRRHDELHSLVEKQLETLTPACVVVDERGKILYVHGRTGAFLELAPGRPDDNILSLARDGLKFDLARAFRQAHTQKVNIVVKDIMISNNGRKIKATLTIQTITEPKTFQGLFLVIFECQKASVPSLPGKDKPKALKGGNSSLVTKLENELRFTKESLKRTIEEFETTYEELKSTNEELQSTNEELQSSNEEIETAKEEMQSLNEELQTTNAELQVKIDQYATMNDDMKYLLNSTQIATLFLDNNLIIKRFTTEAKKIIRLVESDIGRSINDIVTLLHYNGFLSDCQSVLDTLVPKEVDVPTKDDVWYQVRILPYRTAENRIEGLVITFINIDPIMKAKTQLLKTAGDSHMLATIVRDSNDAITVQTLDGKILEWNRGAEIMYGYSKDEALRMNMVDLIPEQSRAESLAILKQIAHGEPMKPFKSQRLCKSGRTVDIWLTITLLEHTGTDAITFATTERDISNLETAQKTLMH